VPHRSLSLGGNQITTISAVMLRLQNCTFDSATVSEGPPANTAPTVTTLKKLCRPQSVTRKTAAAAANALLPGETVQKNMGGEDVFFGVTAAASNYIVSNTVPEDYVEVDVGIAAAAASKSYMFTTAYDGSGALVWYHYTRAYDETTATAADVMIQPTAMTHVRPSIGNKPLTGYWKTLSDTDRVWTSRRQPPDATAAKDVASERVDSATVMGCFLYIVGTIKQATAETFAYFGVTKYPLECSRGKTIWSKGVDLRVVSNTPCAGKLQAQGTGHKDVFLIKMAALGAPRSDWTMTEYGKANVQPAVQWIRRTGHSNKDDVASAVAVHDLTGAIFVTGTYMSSANTKYQGSDIGENHYKASAGSDGGNTYVAESSSRAALRNSGDDVFGLSAAGRIHTVGSLMQSAAPANEHEERMGLTGIPDCTMYSHAQGLHQDLYHGLCDQHRPVHGHHLR